MQSSTPPSSSPTLQQLTQQQQQHQYRQNSTSRPTSASPASSLTTSSPVSASMRNVQTDPSCLPTFTLSRDTTPIASRKISSPFSNTHQAPTPPESVAASSARSTPSAGLTTSLSAAAPQFQTRRALVSEAPIDLRGLTLPGTVNRSSVLGRAVNLPTLKNPQGEVLDLTMFNDGLSMCVHFVFGVDVTHAPCSSYSYSALCS